MRRSATNGSPDLENLLEEFAGRLEAGEAVDVAAFAAAHPEHAAELLRVLPTVLVLADLGRSASAGGAAPPAEGSDVASVAGVLGDFRIVREVGRGGMGVVYEAEQISLGRRVALKVLPQAAMMDPRRLQRFHNEARAAACLHHNNIVPVFFVGSERGVHFYAMQLIEGQTLAAVIHDARQPEGEPTDAAGAEAAASTAPVAALATQKPKRDAAYFRKVAELGAQAAEALDYAHQMGVIHRDVKPSNLMLDGRGQVWVTDFGLAQLQTDAGLTLTGDLIGTLRYMSPEQALAQRVLVDQRTDVYSLGATLYEMLTLRPVFAGEDRQELLRQIAFEEPTPPRRLNRAIPAELETVVLKALEKNPADRYVTAKELADDLRRFLENKPIRARRPSWRQVVVKWARRHRAVVWSAAATVVLTLAVLGGSVGWVLRDRATREAEAEVTVAAAVREAERLLREDKVREALSAAERADGLLTQAGGHPHLSPQVRQLVKDARMRLTLEEIRLKPATEVRDGHIDFAGADQAYAEAFHDYGLDVLALPPAEAAARIRASRIGAALAAALNDWAWARKDMKREKEGWRRLLTVGRLADPDEWRNRLRDVMEGREKGALVAFGELAKADALPAPTLALLLWLVRDKNDDLARAVPLLRRAQQKRPDDFWVNHQLAFALQQMQPPQPDEALSYYRVAVALLPRSPGARLNYGNALRDTNRLSEALAEYREAARLQPDFSEAHNNLGMALQEQGRLDEAVTEYRESLRLKPDYALAHTNLGLALFLQGRLDEAIAAHRKALSLRPGLAEAHSNLGLALADKKRSKEAAAEFHEAIRLKPGLAGAHLNLGNYLRVKGQLDEAIAEYQKAARLKPGYASAHINLGGALTEKGRLEEAVTALRKAVRLKQDDPTAHNNLGAALAKTRPDEAIAAFQEAIRLKKDYAEAHYNLGLAYLEQHLLSNALDAFREAVRLKENYPEAHFNLGQLLEKQGRLEGALAEYQAAVRFKEDYADAHMTLGLVLQRQRRFEEALAALKRGHELGSKNAGWPAASSAQLVRKAERLVVWEVKLPAFRKGEYQPQNNAERLALVAVCRGKTLYLAAARLSADAFAADPKLADDLKTQHRYNAACYAALAAAGEGQDAARLKEKERDRWCKQAVDWLRADLALWAVRLNDDKAEDRAAVRTTLQRWQEDTDLAGLRDPEVVAKLPPPERDACQKLWADVAATLARVEGTNAPAKKPDVK